jgi:hypothetical protein
MLALTHDSQLSDELISFLVALWPLEQFREVKLTFFELSSNCRRVIEVVDTASFECICQAEWA